MTLSYRITFRDRLAMMAYHLPRRPVFVVIMVGLFLLLTFGTVLPAVRQAGADKSFLAQAFIFIFMECLLLGGVSVIWAVLILLAMVSRGNKTLYAERTITLGDDAFVSESQYGRSETRWLMVQKLARTRRHIFIYLSGDSAIVIPRRAFDNAAQWEAFYDACRQRMQRAA